jgi:O-antigen ligase
MRLFGLALLITLPWLNPFSPGPSAAVVPLLFGWACVAGLLLLRAGDRSPAARQRWVHAMAGAWLVAACVSAVIGLLQYFGATSGLGVWANHTEVGLAYGNLRQRNQFASLMTIGLAALLWWAAQTSPDGAGRHTGRFGLAMALAVLLGAGNAASSSRTGLLQLLLVVALSLHWRHRARRQATLTPAASALPWVLLVAVLGYAVANWALPWLAGLDPSSRGAWARLRAGDSVCASRLTLWRNVLYLIAQKPWLGWGWGELDYAHFITLYPGARFCDILDNAHNLPLHLAVALGLPLAVVLCGGGLWLVWRARRPGRGGGGGARRPPPTTPRPLAPYLQVTGAGMLLTFCALAGWQYHLASQIYLPPEQRAPAYRSNTLDKTRQVRLFRNEIRFAELTITDLTPANAGQMNGLAKELLHFSPEARVVEIVIDSARLLGRDAEADFYLARLQAAFPQAHADWRKTHGTIDP